MARPMPTTHNEFVVWVANRISNRAQGVRVGQEWSNALYDVSPMLAGGIMAGKNDPFYLDFVPQDCIEYVKNNWWIVDTEAMAAKNERNYS